MVAHAHKCRGTRLACLSSRNEERTSLRRSSLPEKYAGTFLPKQTKTRKAGFFSAWEQARSRITKYICSTTSPNLLCSRPRLIDKRSLWSSCVPIPSFEPAPNVNENNSKADALELFFCAWEQARTADPSSFNRMLYQLSYPSKYLLV